jgi:predicted dehydrogenase
LAFPGGCIANLTASRVSTERVRKLRFFQPAQYVSVDYARQDIASFRVRPDRQVDYEPVEVSKNEPLRLELEHFVHCMETRETPAVSGEDALRALEVALGILDKIEEQARIVARALAR